MKFLHYQFDLAAGDGVRVELDSQANVQLMDGCAFQNYRSGRSYNYRGGLAERSPFILRAPSAGRWHVTIDLGGYRGSVNASVSLC